MAALSNVIDPERGLDFVELGLTARLWGAGLERQGNVHADDARLSIGPQVTEQIEEFVGELDGVTSIDSQMVFTPPWSPEKMSEDAKFALGY